MGSGFDADGLTSLPQRAGSKRIFVDAVNGSDSYNGLSPYPSYMANGSGSTFQDGATGRGNADTRYGPVKTLAAGATLLTAGAGDHLLLTGSFPDVFDYSLVGHGGYSQQYPTCVRSYDGASPWNTAAYGRSLVTFGAGSPGARGLFSFGSSSELYFAFQGLSYVGTTVMLLNSRYWLIENCTFKGTNIALSGAADSRFLSNIVFRRCSIYGGTDNGLYAGAMTGLVIEDSVFWRNGIPLGSTRDAAQASALTHAMYLSTSCQDAIVRRCVISDPAATGCMARGGGQVYHNVFLKCPIAVIMGAGDQYGHAYPGEPARNLLYATGNLSAGESFTVNGTSFVAGTHFAIGATAAATMDNLLIALVASTAPGVVRAKLGNAYTFNNQSGIPIGPFLPGYSRRQYAGNEAIYIDYDSAFNGDTDLVLGANGSHAAVYTLHPDANPATDHGNTVTGYKPNGVNCEVHHNLILGDADITSTQGRGTGIFICNTKAGSTVHHNVVARSRSMTSYNVFAFNVQSGYPQPTIVQFDRNVVYQWSANSDVLQCFSATQNRDTYTRNVWDKPASGSNTNNAGATLPNPVTRAQVNSALGFADDDAMMTALCAAPTQKWAARILDIALPGYGLSYAND